MKWVFGGVVVETSLIWLWKFLEDVLYKEHYSWMLHYAGAIQGTIAIFGTAVFFVCLYKYLVELDQQ